MCSTLRNLGVNFATFSINKQAALFHWPAQIYGGRPEVSLFRSLKTRAEHLSCHSSHQTFALLLLC